ncbi:MAG: XRE family transcriptional regulator [Treponema sp.]|nr:XRE family transcriptional regulator [Treponema sp.]
MDSVKVGNTIAFLRKQAGMTQNELAKKLNVTDKAVSRWERGIGTPDISLLTRLAAILDTDIEAVLEGNFTNEEPECKGLLVMNYPRNISANTFLYTKRVVYFQLSFFLLAGIREICLVGLQYDADFVKSELNDGQSLGIHLEYEIAKDKSDLSILERNFLRKFNNFYSVFVIDGLDFLYGKDMTSTLKRIILDSELCTSLVNYNKQPLSMQFFPSHSQKDQNSNKSKLFRGMISFPIRNEKDLFDAGNIIKIIEEHQGENIADLGEIAKARGYVFD